LTGSVTVSEMTYTVSSGTLNPSVPYHSVIENVAKLSFASVRMQAAERSHNFVVDCSLQTTSTVVEVSRCRSPSRSQSTNFMHWTSTRRRSPSLISDSVGIDHPCCRKFHGSLRSFSLTGTIF